MNRFQKKCFIVVAGMHALPLLILIVGTAFNSKETVESVRIIEIVDDATVTDGKTQGGGSPASAPAPIPVAKQADVVPPAPAPKPVPAPPEREPEPQKPIVETQKPKPVEPKVESDIPVPKVAKTTTKPTPPAKPVVKTDPRKREIPNIGKPTTRTATDKKAAEAAAQAAQQKANVERLANVKSSLKNLGQSLSSSTTVETPGGIGGGGAAEINYDDYVRSKYYAAWFPPLEATNEEAIVKTRIVIARNGNIISAEITKGSGDANLDSSVRQALRLKNIGTSFPAGARESQRTYNIEFNLKAKRAIG